MSTFYYVPQYFTTQLSVAGGIDDTQTTGIVLQSISGVDETKPGIIAVTWSNPIDTTKVEYITYTSINATTKELQGVTRGEEGYSAKSHVNGATVAWPLSKSHINNINDNATSHSGDDGWSVAGETWTYASASTITVPSGAASKYAKGDKIRWKQGAGYKYAYIVGVADTVLTVTGGSDYTVANDTVTDNYYSHQTSPIGFPQTFTFVPTWGCLTGDQPSLGSGSLAGKFSIIGTTCFFDIGTNMAVNTTFGTGTFTWKLPTPQKEGVDVILLSSVYVLDAGTGYWGFPYVQIKPGNVIICQSQTGSVDTMSATFPITFASGDYIKIAGKFELA